jgi:hypothetical protein
MRSRKIGWAGRRSWSSKIARASSSNLRDAKKSVFPALLDGLAVVDRGGGRREAIGSALPVAGSSTSLNDGRRRGLPLRQARHRRLFA